MNVILERLRVLWLGIFALIIAFVLLTLALMAQRDIEQKLGALKELLGHDLSIVNFQKPVAHSHLNDLSLRLNNYRLAALSPIYNDEQNNQLRAISSEITDVDRYWLKEGRWPDHGDNLASIDIVVYSGPKDKELGSWLKIGPRRYKVIAKIDQKIAGFIFGEIGRELNLLPYTAIRPSQRQISTLLMRPISQLDSQNLNQEALYQYIQEQNLPDVNILSPSDLAQKSNELHIKLTQGLWLMGAICSVLAFSMVLMMLLRDVKDRTEEIGLRRAMGAIPADIANMIVSEVALMMLFAFSVALVIIFVVKQFVQTEWLHYPILGFETIYMVVIIMVLTLILAYLPAARASKISPMQALRG